MPGNIVRINDQDYLEWYINDSEIDDVIDLLDQLGSSVRGKARRGYVGGSLLGSSIASLPAIKMKDKTLIRCLREQKKQRIELDRLKERQDEYDYLCKLLLEERLTKENEESEEGDNVKVASLGEDLVGFIEKTKNEKEE